MKAGMRIAQNRLLGVGLATPPSSSSVVPLCFEIAVLQGLLFSARFLLFHSFYDVSFCHPRRAAIRHAEHVDRERGQVFVSARIARAALFRCFCAFDRQSKRKRSVTARRQLRKARPHTAPPARKPENGRFVCHVRNGFGAREREREQLIVSPI